MPFCQKCGCELPEENSVCPKCGYYPGQGEVNKSLSLIVPIGRSGYAIAAGYLGLLSPLLVFAPFAILFGILALVDIRKHPEKLGKVRAWLGIILGGLVTGLFVFSMIIMAFDSY